MTQSTISPRRAPGFVVSVPITKYVEIARNLEPGTLIYNSDSTNAVWLSSSQTVRPNNGIKLGAFGTVRWLGGPCYAIVDTGVLAAVDLQISNEMQDLVNPIDTAVAVATQLLAQGIPQVFLSTLLFNGAVTGSDSTIDVHAYASVQIVMSGSSANGMVVTYQFKNSTSGAIVDEGYLTVDAVTVGANNPAAWTLPVVGDQLLIRTETGTSPTVRVTGTNVSVPARRMSGANVPKRTMQGVIAAGAPASTIVDLTEIFDPTSPAVPYPALTSFNGPCFVIWRSTLNITGDIYFQWRRAAGAAQTVTVAQNFSTTLAIIQFFQHPFGFVSWHFVSNAIMGASPSTLSVHIIGQN